MGDSMQRAYRTTLKHREWAELTARQRSDEIAEKIPQAGEYIRRISRTGSRIARAFQEGKLGNPDFLAKLSEENLDAQNRLALLLVQNGYPENYLDPPYHCLFCRDTGYREGLQCDCLKRLAKQYAAEEFNTSSHISLQAFSDFSLSYYSDRPVNPNGKSPRTTMGEILEFCQAYAEQFTPRSPSVLMMGETGLGKTHLSLAIARKVMEEGFSAVYLSAPDLFRRLQNEYYGKGEPGVDTMETFLHTDLVILDDLGAEMENQFNVSALYNIVNSRLNAQKPMIISTNLNLKELERRYSSRIASRLMTLYKCLKFVGKDIREQKLRKHEL